MAKKLYGGGSLLNLPGHESTAAIAAAFNPDMDYNSVYISDCSRQITLDITCSSKDTYENSIYKLDTLIATLTEYRKGVRVRGRRNDWA